MEKVKRLAEEGNRNAAKSHINNYLVHSYLFGDGVVGFICEHPDKVNKGIVFDKFFHRTNVGDDDWKCAYIMGAGTAEEQLGPFGIFQQDYTVLREKLVGTYFPEASRFIEKNGVPDNVAAHAGSAYILKSLGKICGIPTDRLNLSGDVLRRHGNTNHVTTGMGLHYLLEEQEKRSGSVALVTIGVGLSTRSAFGHYL